MVENTGGAATPSSIPSEEDKVSTVGSADRDLIYHINGKLVTEEEWTQFHKKFNDQWKHEEDKAEEDMRNRRDPKDHEEAMGENQHHKGNSPPKGTVATLQFPIQQPEGISPMKNILPLVLPRFYGNAAEDPNEFLFEFDILCRSYDYTTNAQKLKLFPTTLKDNALHWFMSLGGGTVTTWDWMK